MGIASLLMPALLLSFTLAELAGTGFQAALGLAEGDSLTEAGVLGYSPVWRSPLSSSRHS